jgi:hypothetical protein
MSRINFRLVTLFVSGLIAVLIGAAIVVDPVGFHATSGIHLGLADAALLNEMRAAGGPILAVGLMALTGLFLRRLQMLALSASAVFYTGYGVARLASLMVGRGSGSGDGVDHTVGACHRGGMLRGGCPVFNPQRAERCVSLAAFHLPGIILGIVPAEGGLDFAINVQGPLLPAMDLKRVVGAGVVSGESPEVDDMSPGGPDAVTAEYKVGYIREEARGHVPHTCAAQPGISAIDRDLSVFCVKASNRVSRAGIPGRGIAICQFCKVVSGERHVPGSFVAGSVLEAEERGRFVHGLSF